MTIATAEYARKPVLVKFCDNLWCDAHQMLAAVGLAPVPHFCFPICAQMVIVVMDWPHDQRASQISE